MVQHIEGEKRVYEDARVTERGWAKQYAVRGMVNKRKEKKGKKSVQKENSRKKEEK